MKKIDSRMEMVKEFHRTFKLLISKEQLLVDDKEKELRIALISEELDELKQAISVNDKEATLDALLDLEYVLLGTVLSFGFEDVFTDAFEEVHRSNMSKVYKYTDQEAFDEEVKFLRNKYGSHKFSFVKAEKPNESIIKRLSDGKVLKPSGYSSADLLRFVDRPDNL